MINVNRAQMILAAVVLANVALGSQAFADALPTKAKKGKSAATQAKETSTVDSKSDAREMHAKALDIALSGNPKGALELLKSLKSSKLSADEMDRVYISIGRIQYQLGNFADSVEAYGKVRKGSASWLESLEERSASLLRLGKPQEALASLKTVLTPIFEDRTASEPFFVTALAQLRVCDYKSVFKTLDTFKERYRDKVKGWEKNRTDVASQSKLHEARETIKKLNLVEAEAIQHLYIDESGKRQAGAPPKIQRESDDLTFPSDSDTENKEVWLDEVDSYKVTTKGCPTSTEAIPLARK